MSANTSLRSHTFTDGFGGIRSKNENLSFDSNEGGSGFGGIATDSKIWLYPS